VDSPEAKTEPISEARANLTELVTWVRHMRQIVFLTRRNKVDGFIGPTELGEAVNAAGGPDAAAKILREHLRASSVACGGEP
jgi:hypothetical protein